MIFFPGEKPACAPPERAASVALKMSLLWTGALAAFAPAAEVLAAEQSSAVQEVVVTAQRRVERLENVPVSVVSLSPDALEKANATNIHDIGRISPGVQINFGGAYTQPSIRGVSSLTNGVALENNVAVYVDGFYVPDMVSINMDLANLASIQVLKGPQGTLYGRNATGGAILINTLAPSPVWTGRFEASYGRFDEKRASGYISGPITDRLRFNVAGSLRDTDGWIKFTSATSATSPPRHRSA